MRCKAVEVKIKITEKTPMKILLKNNEKFTEKPVSLQINKPFSCRYCEKAFTSKQNLQRHTLLHTGEKPSDRPYHCDFCEKSFFTRTDLAKHRRIHTGEKPYACPECDSRFSQSSTLYKHLRKTHGYTDPKKNY